MKFKLRLIIDVTYKVDNPDVAAYVKERLKDLPSFAAGAGLLTGDCDGHVFKWSSRVEER